MSTSDIKQVNWLKILGYAVLTHIILIALSFLTVFIYSLIELGHPESFYESFAMKSAPYVSAVGGFIFMYWFVTRLAKEKKINPYIIGLGLPLLYEIIDLIMLAMMQTDWGEILDVVLISAGMKFLGAMIASYRISKLQDVKWG